jgi:hypothetical protein
MIGIMLGMVFTGLLLVDCFVMSMGGGGGSLSPRGIDTDDTTREPSGDATAIVGSWVWFNTHTVHIDADGGLRLPGTAVVGQWASADAAGHLYELTWYIGFVDHLTLSADGNELAGYNQRGTHVTGTRVQ